MVLILNETEHTASLPSRKPRYPCSNFLLSPGLKYPMSLERLRSFSASKHGRGHHECWAMSSFDFGSEPDPKFRTQLELRDSHSWKKRGLFDFIWSTLAPTANAGSTVRDVGWVAFRRLCSNLSARLFFISRAHGQGCGHLRSHRRSRFSLSQLYF